MEYLLIKKKKNRIYESLFFFIKKLDKQSLLILCNILNELVFNRDDPDTLDEKPLIEIFFSYAWGGEREKIVDELFNNLVSTNKYKLVRDKIDLDYTGLISEFITRIGKGSYVLIAISDKYLCSDYCMLELYELYRNAKLELEGLRKKIFPIYIENINLNSPAVQKKYVKYWKKLEREWEYLSEEAGRNFTTSQYKKLDRIRKINQELGELLSLLSDMNALTPELLSANNFEIIKKAIEGRTNTNDPENFP